MSNEDAAKNAEVVILAVKYQVAVPTLEALNKAGALTDQIVITPIVPMTKPKLCAFTPPPCGSATKECCAVITPGVRMVSTFQTLPAPRLANLDDKLGFDVIVCADDEAAKKTVMGLAEQLGDIRALDGGSLNEAPLIEALTPLLINLAIKNKTKPLSIKFV
jgi:NADPH-dependent F420 reductase